MAAEQEWPTPHWPALVVAGSIWGRARSADARSLPEFWSPATQCSWMLVMRWSTGVR